ncbi:MAG: ABC transporter permease [Pseudomonadota bacterium]|nr:ABC transporter permease [Pseudomonadota bacterium]
MRPTNPVAAAVADISEGFRLTPLWWRLGLEQTYNRYRRTLLGPFWAASATFSIGLSIAFVFGPLLGGSFREGLPHILSGLLAWGLVAGTVSEGTNVYIGSAGTMQAQRLPLSFYSLLSANRVMINFVHQVLAFFVLMAIFRLLTVPHWSLLPAIPVVVLAGFFISIPFGMLAARYRDVGFLIGAVFGALFLLTPVFWSRAQLSPEKRWIADYNPFAHLLEILRQPFLGQMAPMLNWIVSLGIIAGAAVVAILSLALFRKRVIFWL